MNSQKETNKVVHTRKRKSILSLRLPQNIFGFRTTGNLVIFTVVVTIAITVIAGVGIPRINSILEDRLDKDDIVTAGTMSDPVEDQNIISVPTYSQITREIWDDSEWCQLMGLVCEPEIDMSNYRFYNNIALPEDLQLYTYEMCQTYGVRYELFLSLMFRESRFIVDITNVNTNGTTDSGLCQINDTVLPFMEEYGLTDPLDPEQNIQMGCILFSHYLQNNGGDERDALMRYQYGEEGTKEKNRLGIYTSDAIELLYQIEQDIVSGAGMNY